MAEPRCASCRWWRPNTQIPTLPRRQCLVMGTTVLPDSLARVTDWPVSKGTAHAGPRESARVWAEPDFGCVQWEAKDA
jgi:hypothetical protein